MNKVRKLHLKHLFEVLDNSSQPGKSHHVPLFFNSDAWIKFKICCFFQGIEPMDALRNYIKSATPEQIISFARKHIGGKKA